MSEEQDVLRSYEFGANAYVVKPVAFKDFVEAGRHELTVSLPAGPVWLDADLTRLVQVLGNVLTNAAKYTPAGGRIALVARREEGEAVVTVTDTGVGIPATCSATSSRCSPRWARAWTAARGVWASASPWSGNSSGFTAAR